MPAPVTPAAPATGAAGVDTRQVAENLVKGIGDKSAGKPAAAPAKGAEAKAPEAVDPNAGKEKYLVNGKEYFLTPDQARAYAQKGIAFEPRISELARLQQETSAFLQTLKDSPEKVLFDKRIGLTPETALERILQSSKISDGLKETVGKWYYENVVRKAKMSDTERAILERDEKIAEYESADKRKQEETTARENKARVDSALATVRGQIAEAMKEIGLPSVDTPIGVQLAKRVADVMRLSYFARKACTPKEAVAKVREEVGAYQRAFYDALDEDKLVEQLGKTNAEKVRKYFLKLVKDKEAAEKPAGTPPSPRRGERKVVSPDEFRDYLDEVKRNNKI